MSKIFELIRPKSVTDSAYADYEYLIRWIGRDGSEYLYMFYDAEIEKRVNTEVVNQESTTNIKSLINSVENRIKLTANDLTFSELKLVAQIFENPIVRRIMIDDTEELYAPENNSLRYQIRLGRYNVEFGLVKTDTKAWK